MFTSRVLKSVSVPKKILFAVQEGILFSLLGMILLGVFASKIFGMAAVFVAMLYFVLIHSIMIYRTWRDPYFFNLFLLARAKRTYNYIQTGNQVLRYEA